MNNTNSTKTICKFFHWTYDCSKHEILTRNKKTNKILILPWPSLDAIHEAELSLSPTQLTYYTNILCDLTYDNNQDPNIEALVNLSVHDKLHALTKTINDIPK